MKQQEKLEEFINSQPKLGTKEFNDLASAYFGGNPKQETLEEAAEKYVKYCDAHVSPKENLADADIRGFIYGARWQQENSDKKWSDDDVMEILSDWFDYRIDEDVEIKLPFSKWFNEFKNK